MLPLNIPPCRRRFHHAVLSLWPKSSRQDVYVCSWPPERLAAMSAVIRPLKNVSLIPSPISGILKVNRWWESCRSRVLKDATARRLHKSWDSYPKIGLLQLKGQAGGEFERERTHKLLWSSIKTSIHNLELLTKDFERSCANINASISLGSRQDLAQRVNRSFATPIYY